MRSSSEFCRGRHLDRRDFVLGLGLLGGLSTGSRRRPEDRGPEAQVALAKVQDGISAFRAVFEMLPRTEIAGKHIYLKGNFNSAHPYPATTAPEALRAACGILRNAGCASITLIERSGMGKTSEVWQALGVPGLAGRLGLRLLALDDLPRESWAVRELPGSHWKRGVAVPRFLAGEAMSVQICNLKTHRFGGHYSAALKNALGVIAKYANGDDHHNYMEELHNSPHQRLMIAEASQVWMPALSILDATEIFVSEGPERGETARPGVVAASNDRVALDAVGVALLRLHGARLPWSRRNVFEEEQIKRAAELGLGVSNPDRIAFLTRDEAGSALATQLKALLADVKDQP